MREKGRGREKERRREKKKERESERVCEGELEKKKGEEEVIYYDILWT